MIDFNEVAQTAADKYKEGLEKYNENTTTDSAPLEEPNEKEEDVDTSWIDTFSNRDNDRSEFTANDRVDTSIQPETLKEETVFGGESSSTPEDVYDTSYLDEAFANFNTWQQKAEEDAKKGRQLASTANDVSNNKSYTEQAKENMDKWQQMAEENARTGKELAYTNAEVEKQEADALNKALNKSYEAASISSNPLGALKNLGDVTAAIPRSITSGFDGGAEIQKEFKGLNREQQIEKIARNLAENPDYDVEKVLNVLGNNKTLTQTVNAIKDLAKTYETTNNKRADIAANGETATAGISAMQEANKVYQTARENAGITGMERALENYKKAYEANPTDEIAAQIAKLQGQIASASIKVKEEVERVSPNNKKATGFADANIAEIYNRTNTDETIKKAVEQDNQAKLREGTRATTAPTTPTDSSITNEFNEMFANPNTDSLEDYTGKVEEATGVDIPEDVESELDEAMKEGRVNEWQEILRNTPFGRSSIGKKVLDWIRNHPGDFPATVPSDKDSETEDTETATTEEQTVEPTTTETAGIESIIPQEVIANNPEALDDIQEFITNGDSGGLAQYLLNLLGSTALTVIEHAMLSGNKNDPTLQEALKEVWERMPASDKSGMDKERISAINNAFNAEPSNLKSVGISSEDTSATNEADYNKGMTEQTNEIVSDRTKKYVLSNPWILAAIRKW